MYICVTFNIDRYNIDSWMLMIFPAFRFFSCNIYPLPDRICHQKGLYFHNSCDKKSQPFITWLKPQITRLTHTLQLLACSMLILHAEYRWHCQQSYPHKCHCSHADWCGESRNPFSAMDDFRDNIIVNVTYLTVKEVII